MEKIFAIGDIHGQLTMFKSMIQKWNPDNEQLIILGDLIDRGEDSYGVISLAKELRDNYGAIVLKGNHEELFLSWLDYPLSQMDMYYPQGGRETIHSFFNEKITFSHTSNYVSRLIKKQFPEQISFLQELPYYYEWEKYVFVHAGVNLYLSDWKNTKESDFCWIREPFHYGKNDTEKTFIFGHTPTIYLHSDKSTDIWISPCKSKIDIDGGAVYGGQLHGIVLERGAEEHLIYSVDNHLNLSEKWINLSS